MSLVILFLRTYWFYTTCFIDLLNQLPLIAAYISWFFIDSSLHLTWESCRVMVNVQGDIFSPSITLLCSFSASLLLYSQVFSILYFPACMCLWAHKAVGCKDSESVMCVWGILTHWDMMQRKLKKINDYFNNYHSFLPQKWVGTPSLQSVFSKLKHQKQDS